MHWERLKGSRQEEATLDGRRCGLERDKTHGCGYLTWGAGFYKNEVNKVEL